MPKEDTQFKKGHPGGPGRPKGSLSWKETIRGELSKARADGKNVLREVIESLVQKAKQGDVQVARFLAEYSEGKPTQPISGPDGEEAVIKIVRGK